MKPYRIHMAIDIHAKSQQQALGRALLLCSDLEQSRPWIKEVLLDNVEEREWVHPPKKGA